LASFQAENDELDITFESPVDVTEVYFSDQLRALETIRDRLQSELSSFRAERARTSTIEKSIRIHVFFCVIPGNLPNKPLKQR
jgi:hypothetical protein